MKHNISDKKKHRKLLKEMPTPEIFGKSKWKIKFVSTAKSESWHYQYRIKKWSFAKQSAKMS